MTTEHDNIFEQAERLCLEAVDDPSLLPQFLSALKAAKALEHSGWRKQTGMTQNQLIMKHLRKAGSITVREAMVEYSIASLTKRIQELRNEGHNIVSKPKLHPVTRQKYVTCSFDINCFHD